MAAFAVARTVVEPCVPAVNVGNARKGHQTRSSTLPSGLACPCLAMLLGGATSYASRRRRNFRASRIEDAQFLTLDEDDDDLDIEEDDEDLYQEDLPREPRTKDINGWWSSPRNRPRVRYNWQVPQAAGPEVVMVGRSNAGKSTLLNAVLKFHGEAPAAPVSSTCGRTRTLNWFPLGFDANIGWERDGALKDPEVLKQRKGCCLVDCFGFGPIEYSLAARRLQSWGPLLEGFFSTRRTLNTVCHLVSSEFLGAISEADRQLFGIFRRSQDRRRKAGLRPFNFIVVLTKVDLHEEDQIETILDNLRQSFGGNTQIPTKVVACSSMMRGGVGIADFCQAIDVAAKEGWESYNDWAQEVTAPRYLPAARSVKEQALVRHNFTQSRPRPTHGNEGGRGSTTQSPNI